MQIWAQHTKTHFDQNVITSSRAAHAKQLDFVEVGLFGTSLISDQISHK